MIWSLIALSVGLGADAFSVALCCGLVGSTARQKLRLASGFGLLQFLMPLVGMYVGSVFGAIAGTYAGYIGGALLIVLGLAMIWRGFTKGLQCPPLIHTSLLALAVASVGVSIDALAVGIAYALGVRDVNILPASVVIGIVAFLMTLAGVELGRLVGKAVQRQAPVVGGVILAALGIVILLGR